MALYKCPHMTAQCPHYMSDCKNPKGGQCHYVKRTTAATLTAFMSLRTLTMRKMTPEMRKILERAEKDLSEDVSSLPH